AFVCPLRTTLAPCRASTRATAHPMPRVDPVTNATFPLRLKLDSILSKYLLGLGEAAEIDHIVGSQHDVERVFDFGHQPHVSDRIPPLCTAVREALIGRTAVQSECL